MSVPFNIAIDGHSSCGKSTIAKKIASNYGMRYIDTGAMYRALTLHCIRNRIIFNKKIDVSRLLLELDSIKIDFYFNNISKKSETILNGENVESIVRGFEVSDNVSILAKNENVRQKLLRLQRLIGKNKNVVMDGRDIGTRVFPYAELKLFITASASIRAERRYIELKNKGESISFKEVLANINQRDEHDTNRKINPLVQAVDAILIDNSCLSIDEQNSFIDNLITNKLIK